MKIYSDLDLKTFEFWSGGKDRAILFTDEELETIEQNLSDCFPDGMDETALNDIFWFEPETLCEWIGITEEELFDRETA